MMRIEIPAPQWALMLATLIFAVGLYMGWKAGAFWTRTNSEMLYNGERGRYQNDMKQIREQHRADMDQMQRRYQEQYNRLWAELVALKTPPTTRPSMATTVSGDDPRSLAEPAAPVSSAKPQQRGMPRGRGVQHDDRDDFDR